MSAPLGKIIAGIGSVMATDSRDWSLDRKDAWLYALLCGWDCEERFEETEHDCVAEMCGIGGLESVARRHGWSWADVALMREWREVVRRAQAGVDEPS